MTNSYACAIWAPCPLQSAEAIYGGLIDAHSATYSSTMARHFSAEVGTNAWQEDI